MGECCQCWAQWVSVCWGTFLKGSWIWWRVTAGCSGGQKTNDKERAPALLVSPLILGHRHVPVCDHSTSTNMASVTRGNPSSDFQSRDSLKWAQEICFDLICSSVSVKPSFYWACKTSRSSTSFMLSLILQPVLNSPDLRVVPEKPAPQNKHMQWNYFIISIATPEGTVSNNRITVDYQTTRQLIRSGIEGANG